MRGWKLFVAVFLIALTVFYALNLLASVPAYLDEYYAIYTLGSNGLAGHYFPGDQSDFLPGTGIRWYVGVYNHMGGVRLVRVEFKILNFTMEGPDQLNGLPSQRDPFYDETHLLLSNQTWILPVAWSVDNATKGGKVITIHSLTFNNELVTDSLETSSLYGYDFRIVIELWVYDDASGVFSFQWIGNGEERVAWNQLWFNMTRISLLPTA